MRKTQQAHTEEKGRIIVYREYFERLLKSPKSLRDQIIIELPILEGIRTNEVCTLRVENIDFTREDFYVLDSKKDALFPVPLDPQVGKHLATYIAELGLKEGYVLQRRKKGGARPRDPEAPLTVQAVINIWWHQCDRIGIPRMSPRMGRAYFACDWHFVNHKSVYGLMMILRHTNLRVTQQYLCKIIDYYSIKNEFFIGLDPPFPHECSRFILCPMAESSCHCKFFNPNIDLKASATNPLLEVR